MNRIKSVLVIGSFLAASLVNGQASVFSGKIIDKETSEPIPFAHIFKKGTQYGTTSNLYGVFNISLPSSINQLEVTCLGYKPITISISSQADPIIVQLEEDIIQLSEVVVRPRSAESLMKEAFDRLFINYDTSSFALSGRYKMVSMLDSLLVRSIEAELDLYKARLDPAISYKVLPNDSIYIGQLRMINSEFDDYKLKAMVDWENTPYLLKNRDFVREFIYQNKSFESMMKRYDFSVDKMVMLENRRNYVITISPKEGQRKAFWNGKFFLDEETMAFSKIDIVSTPRMFKKLKTGFGYKLQSKVNNVTYDEGAWRESVTYQPINGKWYFNSVNSSKEFLISSKNRGFTNVPVNVNIEYNTSELLPGEYAYDSANYLPARSEGYWQVEKFMESKYDSTFWNDFNTADSVNLR